jgi:hypothetical protein
LRFLCYLGRHILQAFTDRALKRRRDLRYATCEFNAHRDLLSARKIGSLLVNLRAGGARVRLGACHREGFIYPSLRVFPAQQLKHARVQNVCRPAKAIKRHIPRGRCA